MKSHGNLKLTTFLFNGFQQKVRYVETLNVAVGVECDTYTFVDDESKDLGIIKIQPGCKTPLQKVLKGEKTIEGYISGKGKLVITKTDGSEKTYSVGNKKNNIMVNVKIGELMQWTANSNSDLVVYEICYPPYQDGRYENLP